MSDAAERIWATCGEYWRYPTFKDDKTEYVRADLSDALLREAVEALEFYGNPDAWKYPPVKVLDGLFTVEYENAASKVKMDRGKQARATLAKLKAHLGEKE